MELSGTYRIQAFYDDNKNKTEREPTLYYLYGS